MLGHLPRQWMLQASDMPAPKNAIRVHDQFRWTLYANGELVDRACASADRTVVICGVATQAGDPQASMTDIASRLALLDNDALERALYDIVGCYVVFAWSGGTCRILTDPAAALGVYYDPSVPRIASTPLLLGDYPRDPHTNEWFGARPPNNWVPSPYTIFEDILVLPANHVLDVGTWQVRRFWPTVIDERGRSEAAEWISDDLRSAVEAVTRDDRRLHMSLTGGHDSRANLAAARKVVHRMEFFALRNRGVSPADIVLAQRIADAVGVQFRVIDCPNPTPEQLAAYDRQCGLQAFGARRDIVGGCALVANGPAIHINGGLGVLLKNFYGARLGSRSQMVRISELLTDFDRPPELIRAAVEQWLSSVRCFPPQLQRTLMYLEQRASRWMGPADLASTLFYDPYSPFNSRRIAMAAAFAPDQMLEGGRLHRAVIAELWPELLEIPFTKARSPLRRALPRGLKERLRPLKKLLDAKRRAH
ncbi:MAG: hypothetical protein RIB58_10195 [Phycisphaerales bacterium]